MTNICLQAMAWTRSAGDDHRKASHRDLIPLENARLIVIRTMFQPMSGLPVLFRGIMTEVVMISPRWEAST